MVTWAKENGEWVARGPWEEVAHKHVIVTSKNGRETLCRVLHVPALTPGSDREPTDADYSRIVTARVERETKDWAQLMREVPTAARI